MVTAINGQIHHATTFFVVLVVLFMLAAYFAFCHAVGLFAHRKGYPYNAWFGLAFFASPIIAGLVVMTLAPREPIPPYATAGYQGHGRIPCPFCAELILLDAQLCRFCGRDVVATHLQEGSTR